MDIYARFGHQLERDRKYRLINYYNKSDRIDAIPVLYHLYGKTTNLCQVQLLSCFAQRHPAISYDFCPSFPATLPARY